MLSSCTRNALKKIAQRRLYSTADNVASIFRPRACQFLGTIGAAPAIPYLNKLPEVAFTGRNNAGKSSLLTGLLGKNSLMQTNKKAPKKSHIQFYRVGAEPGKLIVVDTPGYGTKKRREWAGLFDHYVQHRQDLRRIYILFTAEHPIHDVDKQMLDHLSKFLLMPQRTQPLTLQPIITKIDSIPREKLKGVIDNLKEHIQAAAPFSLPPIVTRSSLRPPYGIRPIEESIADACGFI